MAHVLVSPLNWGLGHATRDIPMIRELLDRGHEVTIASSGKALALLGQEFPECSSVLFKDYPAPYSSTRFFLPKFTAYIPVLMKYMADERRNLEKILSRDRYDLIISDNRLGVYSKDVPSIFITHQLRFSVPPYLWPAELCTLYVNGIFHKKYAAVIVPDNPPGPLALSGKLARSTFKVTNVRTYYSGIICSTRRIPVDEDLDFLVMISGPEPQRSKLEDILLSRVTELPGEKVVLLGSPGKKEERWLDESTVVKSYVPTEEKVELLNRARFIISRSGYTTMMEVAELGKRNGLFIPTPGQTEQEYLSRYYRQKNWFMSRSQYNLDLAEDVERSRGFNGFPEMPRTEENVKRLYNELLSQYVE